MKQEPVAKPPDEARTNGSARQVHVRTDQSPVGINKGRVCAGEAEHWVYAQYKRRSAEDGQVRQAGLLRKLPSPALKEAERFGSYNPGALNTLTRELYGTAPCKDTQRDEQRAPLFANLRRPERDAHRVRKVHSRH